jgi:Uma2 family endonuclease
MTMMLADPPRGMTIDEFLAMPDMGAYELVEGVLVERTRMSVLSGCVAVEVSTCLANFCKKSGAGRVFDADTTYRCFGDPNTARRGDVSFVSAQRMEPGILGQICLEIPADVIVEIVSPSDVTFETDDKVALYLKHGFGEVWVIDPNARTMQIHRPDGPIIFLQGDQLIVGRGPLAGFACSLRDIFPMRPG